MSDFQTGAVWSYGDLARTVDSLHILFRERGIGRDDKIALIGRNSPAWVAVYVAAITYGAVIVPILPDFNPQDQKSVLEHSDSKLLFIDETLLSRLGGEAELPSNIKGVFLSDLKDLVPRDDLSAGNLSYQPRGEDEVIVISYTSGTSGLSKGVMLTDGNITSNVLFALDHGFHFRGSRVLAILPLAHAYGCSFDVLSPLAAGSHITLLGRIPNPTTLLRAMKEVRPHLLCTVPLVIEKMVRKQIVPALSRRPVTFLLHIPLVGRLIYRKVCRSLLQALGGSVKEVNIGGAALAPDVEQILRKIKFPYTVGYGMTECGPLISYSPHETYSAGTGGRILPGMEARIEDGEILVRGTNVMKGYYKNPEATAAALDSEGWLHTGDMGSVDADGTVTVRGRCKSMILSGSGQNIYPEEIEYKLNALPCVAESVVCEDNGKLVALVVPDFTEVRKLGLSLKELRAKMDANLRRLNTMVADYERVSECRICKFEFEKTAKNSIRRYLYPANAVLMA